MKISLENVGKGGGREGDARNHGVDLNERFYELHPAPSDTAAIPSHKVFLI